MRKDDVTKQYLDLKIRLERIRSKYNKFAISTDTQLYDFVRDNLDKQTKLSCLDGAARENAKAISKWSDEDCRLCMTQRVGKLHRTFIETVCHVYAELDLSRESEEEKYLRYKRFIFDGIIPTLESSPLISTPAPEAEPSLFPFASRRCRY